MNQTPHQNKEPVFLLLMTGLVLVWSGVHPFDRVTWWLEVAPVLIGAPILVATVSAFRLSPLLYRLLLLHAVILMIGARYTYARVPIGFWVQELLGLSRNHYDRIGHFAQGFIPALLAREILLRTSPLRRGKWLIFIVISICLAVSAFYELIEFAYAASTGQSAESFLGTQGDVWDAQWDMSFALIGAVTSLALLSKIHNRFLKKFGIE